MTDSEINGEGRSWFMDEAWRGEGGDGGGGALSREVWERNSGGQLDKKEAGRLSQGSQIDAERATALAAAIRRIRYHEKTAFAILIAHHFRFRIILQSLPDLASR